MSPIAPNIPKINLGQKKVFNISIKHIMQSQLKLPTSMATFGLYSQMQSQPDRYIQIHLPFSWQPMGTHQFCYNYSRFLIMKYLSLYLVSFPNWVNYVELQKFNLPPPHLFLVGSQHTPYDRSRWTHLAHGSHSPHEMPQPNSGWGGSIWAKNAAAKLIWDVCRLRKEGTQEQNDKVFISWSWDPLLHQKGSRGIFKEFIYN